jgi:predicted amino acid racemase/arginase family enzyme
MTEPCITINLEKIEHNARTLSRFCGQHGITISGVSKVACGNPDVAKAMLRGGVVSIGESRMRNIYRLKANGVNAPFILLRTPPLSDTDAIVTSVDISLNSELSVLAALSESALRRGLVHKVILMLDLGDLREGILPGDLFNVTRDIIELEGVKIVGLGTNLSCYGGVVPSEENMGLLAYYADELEQRFNLQLSFISGGNSSSLEILTEGKMPKRINHLRLGESILLGRETINRHPVPGTYQDAFLLKAEIIELKKKPSLPIGITAQDAFGNTPVFEDQGDMVRAILNIGREDIDVDGINPIDTRLFILGASSDHLLVNVTRAEGEISLGDRIEFSTNYSALLAAMTSNYVEKQTAEHGARKADFKGVLLLGVPAVGSEYSPSGKIRSKLTPEFNRMNVAVRDLPDIMFPSLSTQKNSSSFLTKKAEVIEISKSIAHRVEHGIAHHHIPVVMSSEPAASLGVYAGLPGEKEQMGLIVFSAYGGFALPGDMEICDFNRMVLGTALGYGDQDVVSFAGKRVLFQAENVVLIGLRSLSNTESKRISDSMINVYTMEDIDALGMKEVCYRAVRSASMGTAGLHVTCDMSVMDVRETAGILNPVIGGISYREVHLAMEMLFTSDLVRSADITGFSTLIEQDDLTADIAAGFILSLCGKRLLGKRRD